MAPAIQTNKFWIPHQPVLNPVSSSTKLRVFFDGLFGNNASSLNKYLLSGSKLQLDIRYIVKISEYTGPSTAGIQKMFRQILFKAEDYRLKHIFCCKTSHSTHTTQKAIHISIYSRSPQWSWLRLHYNYIKLIMKISLIHDSSNRNQWFHIESTQNHADLVSRGLQPSDLMDNSLWYSRNPQ